MRAVGVSIYAGEGNPASLLDYLRQAAGQGHSQAFTSLHITEQDPREGARFLEEVAGAARDLELRLIADVSPRAFQAMGASPGNLMPFARLGLRGIRVDFGYSVEDMAAMTREESGLAVVINASTATRVTLAALAAAGMDFSRVEAGHNFYPRPETGLSLMFLREKAELLRQYALPVWAFVPSQAGRRAPLYQGLPTVEAHRNLAVARAAAELLASGVVDTLVLGDPRASETELEELASVWLGGSVPLEIELAEGISAAERDLVFAASHENRLDAAARVIRSATSRSYASAGSAILPRPAEPRPAYSVTVDNSLYLRYSGELQITLRDLPPDPRVNVAGRVAVGDRPLVRLLGPGCRFNFHPGMSDGGRVEDEGRG